MVAFWCGLLDELRELSRIASREDPTARRKRANLAEIIQDAIKVCQTDLERRPSATIF